MEFKSKCLQEPQAFMHMYLYMQASEEQYSGNGWPKNRLETPYISIALDS